MKKTHSASVKRKEKIGRAKASSPSEDLRRENEALRGELEAVLAAAKENENIWRHFIEIERILFRTLQLDLLSHELLNEMKARFQLEKAILFISHPEILDRFFPDITDRSDPISENAWILPFPADIAQKVFGETPAPFLLSAEVISGFQDSFPAEISRVESGVLVPICFHKVLFGCLFLGSSCADRYQIGDGTELLEQLGIKIALCMDNCLIYERIRDLAVQDRWTGLLSFFQIHTILEREFRKAVRFGNPLSIMLMELDFFHEAKGRSEVGAEVLKHVGDILKEIFTSDDGFVGRYGSDLFLVVLPGTNREDAEKAAAYLSHLLRKSPYIYDKTAILLSAETVVMDAAGGAAHFQDLLDLAYLELCRKKMSLFPAPSAANPADIEQRIQ